MTTYLAPTDTSPDATAAVEEAARRADLDCAACLLPHVFPWPGGTEPVVHPRAFPDVEPEVQPSSEAPLVF